KLAELVLEAADTFEGMLAAYQRGVEPPAADPLRGAIKSLLAVPGAPPEAASAGVTARFAWTEYEQLMIAEAMHRGELVYNVALRIDSNSVMRAAAFQLIRNVLHGCGTVIALRPEDNSAAANVEIVEAALASTQPQDRLVQRCRIPSIVSDLRIERAATVDTPEHELLGEILEAQAADVTAKSSGQGGGNSEANRVLAGSAAAAVAESTLRVEA